MNVPRLRRAILVGIVLLAPDGGSRAQAGGICTPPEAPLADPDPLAGPYSFCDGGDDQGAGCTLPEECTSGVCRSAARVHNRYLEFAAPASWVGQQLALRVTMLNVDGFTEFNGQTRWIGAPQSYPAELGPDPDATFLAAPLSCEPVYRDWVTSEHMFPYGSEIVPSGRIARSVYVIQAIADGCDTANEALYSPALFLATALFGDSAPYFDSPEHPQQPDLTDIATPNAAFFGGSIVATPGAQLFPNTPDPTMRASMRDARLVAWGFVGMSYPLAGPETCPHRTPECGDGIVDIGEECDDGNKVSEDGCSARCLGENGTAVIRLIPIEPPVKTIYPLDVVIDRNRIYVPAGGIRVWLEVRLADWDPEHDEDPVLSLFQVQIDPAGFESGATGRVAPAAEVTCDPRHRDSCAPVFGQGSGCLRYPDDSAFCSFAYVNDFRLDKVFTTQTPDLSTPAIRFGGFNLANPGTDNGTEAYLGTLVLDVSPDATGTFTIGFNPDRRQTCLYDDSDPSLSTPIPIARLEPAIVVVGMACCLDGDCQYVTAEECSMYGGTAVDACAGDCDGDGDDDACGLAVGTIDDCNSNTLPDTCDLESGEDRDCNVNGVLDSCDLASGTSVDEDGDGMPDECCMPQPPVQLEPLKSRYISLESIGTPGVRSAIRVTFGENDSYPEIVGQPLWVGPPGQYLDPSMEYDNCMYTGAALSCTPHYRDWSSISVLHIFGGEIVPSSTYEIQIINEGCPDTVEANYSDPLPCKTGKWGDTAPPYESDMISPQPDFNDFYPAIASFLGGGGYSYGTALKTQAQLQPNTVLPDRPVDFKDVAAVIAAFLGTTYVDTVPNAGPCACPSILTCGATACVDDSVCAPGFCIDGFCTDKCGRCTP